MGGGVPHTSTHTHIPNLPPGRHWEGEEMVQTGKRRGKRSQAAQWAGREGREKVLGAGSCPGLSRSGPPLGRPPPAPSDHGPSTAQQWAPGGGRGWVSPPQSPHPGCSSATNGGAPQVHFSWAPRLLPASAGSAGAGRPLGRGEGPPSSDTPISPSSGTGQMEAAPAPRGPGRSLRAVRLLGRQRPSPGAARDAVGKEKAERKKEK